MLTVISGLNWGDEGKGRMVDLMAHHSDVVVRYQGGNNAGHTVVTGQRKFVFNLLPSGILHSNVTCILGDGMVIDPEHLSGELQHMKNKGYDITPKQLKISKRATVSMPWHKIQDILEENRLAKTAAEFGSTRHGIAYAYCDKYRKKTIRMGDLLHLTDISVQLKLKTILEAKNLELAGCYHQEPMSYPALYAWCEDQAAQFAPYIADTSRYLETALANGKRVLLEAQLGAMRDIDYGIYPYTSSSSTIAAYAPIGAGIPWAHPDHIIGVLKAYSSCVGAGSFVAEKAMGRTWNDTLREAGHEYGSATGRPQRVGPFDTVAARYGLKMQNADKLALTKLDVLSHLDEIPVITAYSRDGQQTTKFDSSEDIGSYTPVLEMIPGWKTDISRCHTYRELPQNAQNYIRHLEQLLDHEIQFISIGAKRNQFLLKGNWLF
ncbi:adenylosuccinate synthase [uncultured Eubacterium sp.]|uniref:adenylosuccinate synthase n=1 Tax=uncultured Eubacterium sp. TaxID=165185 RepID=UPI0025E1BE43|nr:adenylosuccinate synthase [uncultured Eubacterium sp.]